MAASAALKGLVPIAWRRRERRQDAGRTAGSRRGGRGVGSCGRTWGRRLLLIGGVLAVLWGCGFVWFAWQAVQPVAPPGRADGIVVLTGGAARIEAGLNLLAEGRSSVLLVSGVAPKSIGGPSFADLARHAGLDPAPLEPYVTLGRTATTTLGNAAETKEWVGQNGIHSVILVTAGYHMPRALLELRRALPNVVFFPVPVRPPVLRSLGSRAALRLLLLEYTKLLAAELGLARLGRDAG